MTHIWSIKELLRQVAEENNFLDLDEPELIGLSQSSVPSPTVSSLSSVSSSSTVINETFPPVSPVQSSLSTTRSPSMPVVFSFSPSLRWLLPPRYDPLTVVWCKNNSNSYPNSSQLVHLSPTLPPTQSEIETIANTLFENIDKEMYNDAEFLEVLQEWYKENEGNDSNHQANLPFSLERKRD